MVEMEDKNGLLNLIENSNTVIVTEKSLRGCLVQDDLRKPEKIFLGQRSTKAKQVLLRVCFIFSKLLSDVRTYITVFFFDGLGCFQRLLGRNTYLPFTQQRLNEIGDISSSYRDVLYAATNHIPLRLENQ
ncbi:unnamed protein product [Callosobruchus maculatus]|uniref:Uncharacterized protein n=1 Tax=Callosobruchus maculatus TaxID=64391 RepID=A0A653CQQ6_CALMS|nr:unnamed protein product [Callosobruchus maculatus]